MHITQLQKALEQSWSRETSNCPEEWSDNNPSLGQCAVTALIIQDYLGGTIVWARAVQKDGTTVSHYFNKINDEEIDLTNDQFPPETIVPKGVDKPKEFPSTRERILSHSNTQARYKNLKTRVTQLLKEGKINTTS